MTEPTTLPEIPEAKRPATGLALSVVVAVIALKAFAMGASGSVSVLTSLIDSALDLVAMVVLVLATRWAGQRTEPDAVDRRARALATVLQAGLVFAAAALIGVGAIHRIFVPQPVTGGLWAVGALLLALALSGWWAWRVHRGGDRSLILTDLAAGVVALIGLVSGVFLGAPGLDAAAGVVVMVWLFWGAVSSLMPAATVLLNSKDATQ
jgi:ferrous-iron efflux pump FieF